ncbi:hypothetical protein jhhlp_004487 [Lomentospora prolificans]|uniref:Autophagy-related protein 28 n=1 Tax=Lomentospora prolificans TaxID=41688 RepID=A0A2N3NBP8_9PEZI|nr:hypothetical protein jhhlp_004487 [Lomentospora prolificans]
MAPSSPNFFERFSLSRKGPVSLHHDSRRVRSPSEYNLDELEPRPTDGLLATEPPELTQRRRPRRSSPENATEPSLGDADTEESPKPARSLFAGPPPPIARSTLLVNKPTQQSRLKPRADSPQPTPNNITASLLNIGSVLFDHRDRRVEPFVNSPPDSIWQNLRRRERAVEEDLQQALDMQAAALASSTRAQTSDTGISDPDAMSDGGSSTPTGTFYSTASSKSRMTRSLNPPVYSTPDGNVIPIRQPPRSKRGGIRTARQSLLRSMMALADLKVEEDARVAAAISQRKMALARARKLAARQQRLMTELQSFEEDEEEPLGKELKKLKSQRVSLTSEIKELEDRLVGLRNKRRWVDGRIEDVRNRREAGLSGYKGALREVESDVALLTSRPPVAPLDRVLWENAGETRADEESVQSPGGEEFLRLIPERRTLEMARSWWEAELEILEDRRKQVDREREALGSGERMWNEVIEMVTQYESSLQDLVKGNSMGKGKNKAPSIEEMANQLVFQMTTVIASLESKLREAEENQWNLLICAIGAELDAFKEAESVLRRGFSSGGADTDQAPRESDIDASSVRTESPIFKPSLPRVNTGPIGEESDNEVPQDLLVSPVDAQPSTPRASSPAAEQPPPLDRSDSENSVPREYLADTQHLTDT